MWGLMYLGRRIGFKPLTPPSFCDLKSTCHACSPRPSYMASVQELRIAGDGLSLFTLPNEVCILPSLPSVLSADNSKILIHTLDLIPTQWLLLTRLVCRRFSDLIARVIHGRLVRAALFTDRKLILECYHPSAQYTEPYLYCDYLGTAGLKDEIGDQARIYEVADDQAAKEGTLERPYSYFRPTRKDAEPKIHRSHPAGDVPGSRTSEIANRVRISSEKSAVSQNVSLEAHELFTQLHFLVAVVQTGPRPGLFLSIENLVDKTQRIFRTWLAERAEAIKTYKKYASNGVTDELGYEANRILWIDQNKIVGLRLRVEEIKGRKIIPILYRNDEDQAISYSLELEGNLP